LQSVMDSFISFSVGKSRIVVSSFRLMWSHDAGALTQRQEVS